MMGWESVYKQNAWEDISECPELPGILSLCNNTKKIIDIGCSFGRLTIPLAKLGFQMTAIDIAKEPIRVLLQKTEKEYNIAAYVCNASKLPFESYNFDGCIAVNSIYHGLYQDVAASLYEIERVLSQDGWFFGTFLSKEDWKYGKGQMVEKNVYVSMEGPDINIPHWFASQEDIYLLFSGWRKINIEHKMTEFNSEISAHWLVIAEK